jgi:hypothetical protein
MVAGVKILKSAETEASGGALDNVTRAQQTVLQPGAADKPWWVDSQTGRLWASSAFNLVSLTRYAMQPVQAAGWRSTS